MPTRNIELTDRQAAFLDQLVASGRFQDLSEAMSSGLHLLEREESLEAQIAGVMEGYAQFLRGEFAEGTGEEAIQRAYDRAMKRLGS